MRAAILIGLIAAAILGAVALDGAAPFSRAALWLGAPETAIRLARDPMVVGVARYRQGRYDEAADAFRRAGSRATFNWGGALARAGRYREAIAAYRALLLRDPSDEEARFNLAQVLTLYEAPVGSPLPGDEAGGDGSAPAGSTPSRLFVAGGAGEGGSKGVVERAQRQTALVQRSVRRGFEGRRVAANRRWLATLPDRPGGFSQSADRGRA